MPKRTRANQTQKRKPTRFKTLDINGLCHKLGLGMPKWKNPNPFAPQSTARSLYVGPSGIGKTSYFINLLLNGSLTFQRLFCLCKDKDEPKYQLIKHVFGGGEERVEGEDDVPTFLLSNKLSDLPPLDSLDRKTKTILVFDDFLTDKQQKIIEEWFIRARKHCVSSNYIGQGLTAIPKLVRRQASHMFIWRLPDSRQVRNAHQMWASELPWETFKKLYQAATAKPHDFLLIDLTKTNPRLKYRHNMTNGLTL